MIQELPFWKPWWEQELKQSTSNNKHNKIIDLVDEKEEDDDKNEDGGSRNNNKPIILKEIKKLEELTKKSPNPNLIINLVNLLYPLNSINLKLY